MFGATDGSFEYRVFAGAAVCREFFQFGWEGGRIV